MEPAVVSGPTPAGRLLERHSGDCGLFQKKEANKPKGNDVRGTCLTLFGRSPLLSQLPQWK